MIPFRSVGCSKGILPGYPVAELTIEAEGEKISPGQVYIGVSENILSVQGSYQILLHPALLKKGRRNLCERNKINMNGMVMVAAGSELAEK